MTIIIIVVILVMWIWSFIKFKRKMKYFSVMNAYLQEVVQSSPTPENFMRLAGSFIEIQHYKDAYDIIDGLLSKCKFHPNMEQLRITQEFCKNPVPGTNKPKNFNQSWLHNFLLVRLGKRRYNFLTADDYLKTNSIMRQMGK